MLFQIEAEFTRMTHVKFTDSLKQFWTNARLETALRKISADKLAKDAVAAGIATNVMGQFSILLL